MLRFRWEDKLNSSSGERSAPPKNVVAEVEVVVVGAVRAEDRPLIPLSYQQLVFLYLVEYVSFVEMITF